MRKLEIDGQHTLTFPDYYVKLVPVYKSVYIQGTTNAQTADFTSELTAAGINVNDIIAQWITAFNPQNYWSTIAYCIGNSEKGKFMVCAKGSESQYYGVSAIFAVRATPANA